MYMNSLMERARVTASPINGPASASPAHGVNGAPITGPANKELPAGQTGVGLDAFSAARRETMVKFQALRANQSELTQLHGAGAVAQALENAYERAMAADAEYRRAAASAGVGAFAE